ncbi:MAG: A/G-specific adenine glycosylase [Paracoccaceae bacterium]
MQDSAELLAWYDAAARQLPWRVPPGAARRALPYHVWLSEIMLQQTTVAAVKPYFEAFLMRWPSVAALAAADDAEVMAAWAGLGYYARARNLLACARSVAAAGGGFPQSEAALRKLPGIGPYTAAAIAAIAFDAPATVVDGNVERVIARRFAVLTPLPAAKPELTALAATLTPSHRPGDYAQAMMDLGATICTPRSPKCESCPWAHRCKAHTQGIAARLPARTPKAPRPTRHGHAYAAFTAQGEVLLETRPPKGLLGGMLALPCSEWSLAPAPNPPLAAQWHILNAPVRHVFTHFELYLTVHWAITHATPTRGSFTPMPKATDLPSVMRKALAAARMAANM